MIGMYIHKKNTNSRIVGTPEEFTAKYRTCRISRPCQLCRIRIILTRLTAFRVSGVREEIAYFDDVYIPNLKLRTNFNKLVHQE